VLSNDPFNVPSKKVPGAGSYDVPPSISPTGSYFNSKFKSSGVKMFDPPRSQRFPQTTKTKRIGPG